MKTGTFVNSGQAPYKHDANNQPSYFVQLKDEKGALFELWGLGLKDALEKNPVQSGDHIRLTSQDIEGTRQKNWSIEKIEPVIDHINSIEVDDRSKDMQPNASVPQQLQSVNFKKDDVQAEAVLPDNIRNNFIYRLKNANTLEQQIHFYNKEDPHDIAFEDRNTGLHTSRQDESTVRAMIDLAESKGWTAIKLKGTEEFKQKAWLEATLRGIDTKGYQPTDKDYAQLEIAKTQRTVNEVQAEQVKTKSIVQTEQTGLNQPKVETRLHETVHQNQNVSTDREFDPFTDLAAPHDEPDAFFDYPLETTQADAEIELQHELQQSNQHQKIVDEAIQLKQAYYETPAFIRDFSESYKNGQTSDVLSDQYYHLDKFHDARLISITEQGVSHDEAKLNALVTRSSNGLFVYQTVADIAQSLPPAAQTEILNKQNHRLNYAYQWTADKENVSLKDMVIPIRHDLSHTLERHNIKEKADILAAFDQRMIDYSKQVADFQRSYFQDSKNNQLNQSKAVDFDLIESEKLVHVINAFRDEVPHQEAVNLQSGAAHLRVVLDEYKDQLDDKFLVSVDNARKAVEAATKDHPAIQDQRLHQLAHGVVRAIEHNQQFDLLYVTQKPDIDVQISKQGDQDRGR